MDAESGEDEKVGLTSWWGDEPKQGWRNKSAGGVDPKDEVMHI